MPILLSSAQVCKGAVWKNVFTIDPEVHTCGCVHFNVPLGNFLESTDIRKGCNVMYLLEQKQKCDASNHEEPFRRDKAAKKVFSWYWRVADTPFLKVLLWRKDYVDLKEADKKQT